MPFDPALAGLSATGITKLIETDIGDKCLHHVTNMTTRDDRKKDDDEQAAAEDLSSSTKDHSKHAEKRAQDKEWSRKSYWRSGRHQQKASAEPRFRPNEVPQDEWSRKTYWRRSWHQQQPTSRPEEKPLDTQKPMSKADRKEAVFREQRRDKFRDAKDSYVPAASCSADEMSWDEGKLYADVGRAVREASRRSGEEVRGGHW
ncbi:hypothetical protein Slin14017_G021830 [Septoria linicola]|nr:hypothetical protein Slin14017_G021830 [Septoria linicola]